MTEYKNNRLSRISDLLLIESEVLLIQSKTQFVNITDCVARLDYYRSKYKITPIEELMLSILECCRNFINIEYDINQEIGINFQKKIGKYIVDFQVNATWSDTSVIIECDGHDFHEKTKEQVTKDKIRERFLVENGYKVLRFSGSEIYNNFDEIYESLKVSLSPDSKLWGDSNE